MNNIVLNKNKILSNIKEGMTTIKKVLNDFGLKNDVREGRKFLKQLGYDINKNTPKKVVNKLLKEAWNEIEEESNPFVYLYNVEAESRQETIRKKTKYLSNPEQLIYQFQSKDKYRLKQKFNISNLDDDAVIKNNPKIGKFPIVIDVEDATKYLNNTNVITELSQGGEGSKKVVTILKMTSKRIRKLNIKLEDIPLFNCSVNLPYNGFNGFKDSGIGLCVPETILHHLKSTGHHKKTKLEDVINILCGEGCYDVDDDDGANLDILDIKRITEEEEENNEYGEKETFDEGGFSPIQIINCLNYFKCRVRLLDFNCKEFLSSDFKIKFNRHLHTFVGICYNGHLYYCEDPKFVKTISAKSNYEKNDGNGFDHEIYNKKCKKDWEDKRELQIIQTDDLMDMYLDLFQKDNTIRNIKTNNGKITQLTLGNSQICANKERDTMKQVLGDKFVNQTPISIGKEEFNEWFPNHKMSKFTKDTYDLLEKHGNIVENLNEPTQKRQAEYDINKCRTDKLMNNKLGKYEIFDVSDEWKPYDGKIKFGLYWVKPNETGNLKWFKRGHSMYSGDFIKEGIKRGITSFKIEYQLLASDSLPQNHFKDFTKHIVKKYPNFEKINPNNDEKEEISLFKSIINMGVIGMFGKTQSKTAKGYIESDYEMAVSAFWDNNDNQIGFIGDNNINKKLWKVLKGNLSNIKEFDTGKTIIDDKGNKTAIKNWIVEATEYKTMYENNLPLWNKVLENEYLHLYDLQKELGGIIIKIKTDAIIVEDGIEKYKRLKTNRDVIGGIKYCPVYINNLELTEKKENNDDFEITCEKDWKVYEEKLGDSSHEKVGDLSPMTPTDNCIILDLGNTVVAVPKEKSMLITGLAGFGKTYVAKQLKEYKEDTTLRLAFTNVSADNLADDDIDSKTLCSHFGINFKTGKGSEKKLKNLKNIKCIMITEIFMTPSYIMNYLIKIKNGFPHIKFICEGDPEQTRPVKQEHINWIETQLLNNLCDGNMIKLKYNKRSNETENYYKIIEGEPLCKTKFSNRSPRRVNIVRTNTKRVEINDIMMNLDKEPLIFIENIMNCKDLSGAEIYTTYHDKAQDILLSLETPIMAIKNNKKINIKNGKMYKIININVDTIEIDTGFEKTLWFSKSQFMENFVVAYAFTNHKVQGITIKEKFNIYEWSKMSPRERYTAYSRTSDGENVKIITGLNT